MYKLLSFVDQVKHSNLINKGVACLSTLKTSILMGFLLIMFVGIGFSSCDNQEENSTHIERMEATSYFTRALTSSVTTTYYSTPTKGNFSPNSSSTVKLGISRPHYGGIIRAQLLNQSGSKFTVRISKQSGGKFSGDGLVYVTLGSVEGKIVGNSVAHSGTSYVDVSFNASFAQGYTHFYPIFRSLKSGEHYYAEPILVYTQPMYSINYKYGAVLGTANGVEVRCNGTKTNMSGEENQCTNFCIRYYNQVYRKNYSHFLTAYLWFQDFTNFPDLDHIKNGDGIHPRIGDILCFSGGPKNRGHVAIIMEVGSNFVKIAHQNSGSKWSAIGAKLSLSGTTIANPTNYKVEGWLRCK